MIELFIEWLSDGQVYERLPVGICRFGERDGMLAEMNWQAASASGWLVPRQPAGRPWRFANPCANLVFPDDDTCKTQALRFGAQMMLSYEIGNSPKYGSKRDLVVTFKCEEISTR